MKLPPIELLSDRHQQAFERFAWKFFEGAQQHGDLTEGKDWTQDMLDELTDLAFYAIFQALERK